MNRKYKIELTEDEMIRYYANKIVEDALSNCSEFNYCIDVDCYNDNGFVEQHQKEILDRILKDERVSDAYIETRNEPHSFDMVFWLDYCPHYYEENELRYKDQIRCIKLFIDEVLVKHSEFITLTTIRALVNSFNNIVERDCTIEVEDKSEYYYCIKEMIYRTGFIDKYLDKCEVYVDKNNINELIELLNNEIEKIPDVDYEEEMMEENISKQEEMEAI